MGQLFAMILQFYKKKEHPNAGCSLGYGLLSMALIAGFFDTKVRSVTRYVVNYPLILRPDEFLVGIFVFLRVFAEENDVDEAIGHQGGVVEIYVLVFGDFLAEQHFP